MAIKTEIYDLLTDYIEDSDKVDEVYNKVEELETSIRDNYKKDIHKLKEHIIEIENKLDYEERQNKLMKNVIKHFSVFRCALNKVVHEYWLIYKSQIETLDYVVLTRNYKSRKRQEDGFKYAIARIHDKCDGLSKELCELYLSLNDLFHPKTKPISVIEESIQTMNGLIETNSIPDYYIGLGLTKELLSDFEVIIKKNSGLFV